jgi:maleate isomerase
MPFTSWRGLVGLVKPTRRPGSLEELVRMLPEGVGLIPCLLNVRGGTLEEFKAAPPFYEEQVKMLAGDGADLIICSGTPPFMLLGRKGEADLVRGWERKYKTRIFSQGMTHVNALRALGVKRFVGASYSALQNEIVVKYMTQAGFDIADMRPIEVPFDQVGQLSPEQVYGHIKRMCAGVKRFDGIYIQGGGWRMTPIIEDLERDLGVPVLISSAADCWEIQHALSIRKPVQGLGRLLAELPPPKPGAK